MYKKIITRKVSENSIQNSILLYLNSIPKCFAWRNNSVGIYDPQKKVYRKKVGRFDINGVSDIICIYNGHTLFIEVKTPNNKNKLSIAQKEFMTKVTRCGGIAYVASSIQDVADFIKKL